MRCPKGHIGPFEPILIGLPDGEEWWLQCRAIDEECECPCWCDERFPDMSGYEGKLDILISSKLYAVLEKRYADLVSDPSGELLYKRRMRVVGSMRGCTGHMQKCYENGECTGHA